MSDSIVIEDTNGEVIVIEPTLVINQTTCAAEWGGITGTIGNQADLVAEFAKKLDKAPTVLPPETDLDTVVENGVYSIGSGMLVVMRGEGATFQVNYIDEYTVQYRNGSEGTWNDWIEFASTYNLSAKQDKEDGKGLSTNDYTTAEKTKLAGVEAGAQVNAVNTVIDANYVHTDNNYTDTDKAKLAAAVTSSTVTNIVTLTQTAYNALNPKVATTLYIITGV